MKKSWMLVSVVVLTFFAAACGGSADPDPVLDNGGGDNNQDANNNGNGDGTSGGSLEVPEIDAGSMPPPGEAHISIDGETFVFLESEMIQGAFTCEIRDNGVTINFQSDGSDDMTLQSAVQGDGSEIGSTTVVPGDSDFRYSGSTNRGGGIARDGNHVLLVANFDKSPKDDLADISQAGPGEIKVTCP